ncbi:MAG: 50S ribosome-binding GTPase [Bacteroidales bacterium]|nr:50S ribosome-binding GTPase [Bacteroidales bacterium]
MIHLLRVYWREILRVLVLLLPVVAFSLLGVVWLFERGYLLYALAGCALLGLVLLAPTLLRRRRHHTAGGSDTAPDDAWSHSEEGAWRRVQAMADAAQDKPPESIDELKQLANRVVQGVATELHGRSKSPWANFTFPEILLALETTASNLRQGLLTRVPGSDAVSLAHLLALYDAYQTYRPAAFAAWNLYRVFRLLTNPVQALAQEVSGQAQGSAAAATRVFLTGMMARLLVEELGRSTIDLYAGRYRMTPEEALRALSEAAPAPATPVPIRILLAGQVNAGKSSLTNALLGTVQSPVSELPTPGGMREFRVSPDAPLDLVILDSPGLTPGGGEDQTLLRQIDRVDLILWVTQANKPGREPDAAALEQIRRHFQSHPARRPPAMILVMTHSDKLSPVREWSPPYDLENPAGAKAIAIADALARTGEVLGFDREPMVPVALPPHGEPYNLDALWAAIGANLDDAQLGALDRALKKGASFSLARTFSQCREGGRFLLGAAWKHHLAGRLRGDPGESDAR